MSYKIVVADDHALTLQGVVRALESAHDIEVVGTASRGTDVMSLVKSSKPDVALLDYNMPGMDGVACLELIRNSCPEVKVVMLSAFDDRQHIDGALDAGASAYVVKTVDPVDLPSVLRQVCMGTVYHASKSRDDAAGDAGDRDGHGLTEREMTMLSAVARGLSNKAISAEFWVTEQTVKFHLNNVYRKLGVHNRAGAVRYAFEHGMVAGDAIPA